MHAKIKRRKSNMQKLNYLLHEEEKSYINKWLFMLVKQKSYILFAPPTTNKHSLTKNKQQQNESINIENNMKLKKQK